MSEEVAQIKATIDDIKEKLSKIEGKRDSIRDSVFQKVKEDYEKRLETLSGQLVGKKELLKETLKEMATKKEPLKDKLDDLQEQLEEIELRHSIGEYSDGQYDSMSGEIKEKMGAIEGDLQALKKEEEETKELLGEPLDVIEEQATEEKVVEEVDEGESEEREEEEVVEEEPLPEVSKENMIAEELFTGKEQTIKEKENVLSDVPASEEEKDSFLEGQEEEAKSDEKLFDLSEGKVGETKGQKVAEKKPSGGSAEEEDWLSSLEQELNEEAEEKVKKEGKAEKVEKAEKNGGEELVSLCPKCNYKNKPDAWYCENCGSELASPE